MSKSGNMTPSVLFSLKLALATEDALLWYAALESIREASQKAKEMPEVMSPLSTETLLAAHKLQETIDHYRLYQTLNVS